MLPVTLAPAAHHDQVAGPRREVMRRAAAGRVGVLGRVRAQQPGSAGTEREHGDDRVVEPTHVGVAMERLAVASVPVLQQAEPVELHAVAVLQCAGGVGQGLMRQRVSPLPPRPEPPLLHEMVVAEQLARLPRHRLEQVLVDGISIGDPAAGDVDPRPVAELDALDCAVAVDLADITHPPQLAAAEPVPRSSRRTLTGYRPCTQVTRQRSTSTGRAAVRAPTDRPTSRPARSR